MSDDTLICSFCSKSRKDVTKMIVGATKVAICNECVKLCVEILDEDITKTQNAVHKVLETCNRMEKNRVRPPLSTLTFLISFKDEP